MDSDRQRCARPLRRPTDDQSYPRASTGSAATARTDARDLSLIRDGVPMVYDPDPSNDGDFGPLTSGCKRGTG